MHNAIKYVIEKMGDKVKKCVFYYEWFNYLALQPTQLIIIKNIE
jgi:hypothetical protein